jgi:DNA polymerase-2
MNCVMPEELTGWLLDIYAGGSGLILWFLESGGQRRRLEQVFPLSFYIAGAAPELRAAWRWLASQPERLRLRRAVRRDLFSGPVTVLAVEVGRPLDLPPLFRRLAQAFPALTYYDADIPLSLRYAAATGVFPLAQAWLKVDDGRVTAITPLSSPWDLDPEYPPVRILRLEPDCDPAHAEPQGMFLAYNGCRYRQPLAPARALLVNLRAVLESHDPDLVLTAWGDTWLLPRLIEAATSSGLPLPLNRDPAGEIKRKQQRSYQAYGQIIYRGAQVLLAGRWHVDVCNAVMYHDYGLEGVLELARITSLPVQTAARVSPGTGISSMQILTALRREVLVPYHKQQAEEHKSVLDLLASDMGGMVYQPTTGVHADVAEVDFVSMYPSIMAHFNISPETVIPGRREAGTGLPVTRAERGLVPETLEPLLQKRIALKTALLTLPKWDPRRKRYRDWAAAYKWLLVTCFGYLGYKNARFGRIEAHEAVTAYGREALLRAKEAAEDLGCEVLHLYVDGMWVKKPGWSTAADFQPLLEGILARTGLPIALDGVFRWVAFLPSRLDARVPVPNRYFGVFQDGEIKVRGIELRRRDTPAFVAAVQQELLDLLARASSAADLPGQWKSAQDLLRRRLADLRQGRVPPRELIVRLTLSRELDLYRAPSPAAIAARQLQAEGKNLRPGQAVRFVHTLGKPGVRAWDLPGEVDPRTLNWREYRKLLLRAAGTVLEPFNVDLLPQEGIPLRLPVPQRAPAVLQEG